MSSRGTSLSSTVKQVCKSWEMQKEPKEREEHKIPANIISREKIQWTPSREVEEVWQSSTICVGDSPDDKIRACHVSCLCKEYNCHVRVPS
jgi:hypothetical protein